MADSSRLSSRRSSVSGDSLASARSTASTASTATSTALKATPRGLKGSLGAVASRNLRGFSEARCLIQKEIPQTPETIPSFEELERDLNGWNGTWKKKKAAELMKERMRLQMAEDIEKRLAEEERRRKIEERQEWLRRAKEQEQQEILKEMERCRAKQRAAKAACSWQLFSRRALQEEERLQQRLRHPTACGACSGSGRCQRCNGQGSLVATYLAPSVKGSVAHPRFHGRSSYGCSSCGGFRDGSEELGESATFEGTGRCTACKGHGQIWPTLAEVLEREKRAKMEKQRAAH
eukprot:gb/GFBE01043965.1/.p1 GENE.gb/GFBE01043965.1/~~gb/GFBE01043965.1/.p1  ORF type:complete len:292 (+),score=72.09 gb/GFBE01043965.1/:1-876(+)